VLVSAQGQNAFAQRLFNAFKLFKKEYESGGVILTLSGNEKNEQPAEQVHSGEIFFAIQILSVKEKLALDAPDLKGNKDCSYIKVGNQYKYYIGKYKSKKEAAGDLQRVRKTFPGAFITQYKE
jgi:hypothetical protein